jgi:hypothetical protein
MTVQPNVFLNMNNASLWNRFVRSEFRAGQNATLKSWKRATRMVLQGAVVAVCAVDVHDSAKHDEGVCVLQALR